MIEVTVSRAPGDRQGDDITDALITSEAGARARANAEIDANMYNRTLIQSTGPFRDQHIAPGALIENLDTEQQAWQGQVERSAITMTRSGDSYQETIALEIERAEL